MMFLKKLNVHRLVWNVASKVVRRINFSQRKLIILKLFKKHLQTPQRLGRRPPQLKEPQQNTLSHRIKKATAIKKMETVLACVSQIELPITVKHTLKLQTSATAALSVALPKISTWIIPTWEYLLAQQTQITINRHPWNHKKHRRKYEKFYDGAKCFSMICEISSFI